jgi:hypothetical protein
MANIMNFVINVLEDKLENLKGEGMTMWGADMGYELLDEENTNGTYTFDSEEASNWIKEYYDDTREVAADMEFNMGAEYIKNPYTEPEVFMVQCMLEVSSRLCSNCEFVDEHWNEEIEFTDENIELIKQQLEAQRDTEYIA